MTSYIQEIENNESLLLMYLAGELPPEDRAEVEQMLARDASLRNALADIESSYEFAIGSLAQLDADHAAIAGENHAIRQAKRAMNQWQIDRSNRQPVQESTPFRRVPSWAYPSAVAAMVLIGLLTYWGVAGENSPSSGSNIVAADKPDDRDHPHLERPERIPEDDLKAIAQAEREKADMLELSLARSDVPAGISDAESKAKSLVVRSNDSTLASSVFWVAQ